MLNDALGQGADINQCSKVSCQPSKDEVRIWNSMTAAGRRFCTSKSWSPCLAYTLERGLINDSPPTLSHKQMVSIKIPSMRTSILRCPDTSSLISTPFQGRQMFWYDFRLLPLFHSIQGNKKKNQCYAFPAAASPTSWTTVPGSKYLNSNPLSDYIPLSKRETSIR